MTLILGIAVTACALVVIGLIIRKAIRGDTGADEALYRTNQGRDMPPRSPARKKRGW